MLEWIRNHQLALVAAIGCGELGLAAALAAYMRPNYFKHKKRPSSPRTMRFKRLGIRVGKNLLRALSISVVTGNWPFSES